MSCTPDFHNMSVVVENPLNSFNTRGGVGFGEASGSSRGVIDLTPNVINTIELPKKMHSTGQLGPNAGSSLSTGQSTPPPFNRRHSFNPNPRRPLRSSPLAGPALGSDGSILETDEASLSCKPSRISSTSDLTSLLPPPPARHSTRPRSSQGFESSSSSAFQSGFAVLPDASSTTNSNTNTTTTSQPDSPSRHSFFLGLEIRRSKRKSISSPIEVPPVACPPIPEWALQQRAGAIDKLTRPQATASKSRPQTANANLGVGKRDSLHVPVASGSRTARPKSTHGYPASSSSSGWTSSSSIGWGASVPSVPPLPSFARSPSPSGSSTSLSSSKSSRPSSPTTPRPSSPTSNGSWLTSNTYDTTPKFSRLSLASSGVVLPVSAREHKRVTKASSSASIRSSITVSSSSKEKRPSSPTPTVSRSSTSSSQSRTETSSQSRSSSSNSVGERGDHTPSLTRSSSAASSYDEDSLLAPPPGHASRSPSIASSDITTIVEDEEERESGGVSSMGVLSDSNPNSNSTSEEEKGHMKRFSISSGLARMKSLKSLRAKGGAKSSGDLRKTAMPNKGSVDVAMMPKGSVDLGVARVSDESAQAGVGGVSRSTVTPGEENERVTVSIDIVPQPGFYTEEGIRKAASVGDLGRGYTPRHEGHASSAHVMHPNVMKSAGTEQRMDASSQQKKGTMRRLFRSITGGWRS
ncbi:hypothetical protein BDQ12DRAFT_694337 [Crucibulum laeve]|uniref:Uncharacterized protein n=1 Tax=Crucibulum laeve TaxID=68775 RepID=A0A5C3LRF8_9AGAR|nr:hypothetical protein BDQ12DRAFT_694337 [Crucibulum laeve]